MAFPELPHCAFLIAQPHQHVRQPPAQPRGVVDPRHVFQIVDRFAEQLGRHRILFAQPRDDAVAGRHPYEPEAVTEALAVFAHPVAKPLRARDVALPERRLGGDREQPVCGPHHVSRPIRDRHSLLSNVHGLRVVPDRQIVGRESGVHSDLRMQLDRPAPRAPRHDQLEGLVEILLRAFELSPRNVEVRGPHQDPRQQVLLIERTRGRDGALGQRETRVPVAAREGVLHRQLVDVHAEHGGAQLVGQLFGDAHVMQHARPVAGEPPERGQTVVCRPRDGLIADLLRQLERTLAVRTSHVGRSHEDVKKEKRAVRACQQTLVSQALRRRQRRAQIPLGFRRLSQRLPACAAVDLNLRSERVVARFCRGDFSRVEVRQRLLEAPAPVAREPHATLHARTPTTIAAPLRLAASPLPQAHRAVVIAEALACLREVVDQCLGVEILRLTLERGAQIVGRGAIRVARERVASGHREIQRRLSRIAVGFRAREMKREHIRVRRSRTTERGLERMRHRRVQHPRARHTERMAAISSGVR